MQPLKLFAAILLATLVISCQKELNIDLGHGGSGSVPAGTLKMKINGSQWTATKGAGASIIAGFINISGISSDNKSLTITLNDSVPGTYVLDQTSFHEAALSDSSDLAGLSYTTYEGKDTSQASGVVIVTAIDKVNKTISGTFHFKLYRDFDSRQKLITEGVFNQLSYSATLPPASLSDTFHVKIDNVDWKGKSISGTFSGTDLIITASELDVSKVVALSVPANITTGTYNLDAVAGKYIGVYSPNGSSFLASQSGKLTILEYNKTTRRIRGNFDFKAIELGSTKTAQLTAGYFSLIYQ